MQKWCLSWVETRFPVTAVGLHFNYFLWLCCCVLKVVKRAKGRGKAKLTSCPWAPDAAHRAQMSGRGMEALEKKLNEIGMQASASYQSSSGVI